MSEPPHRPTPKYERRIESFNSSGKFSGPNLEKIFADCWQKENERKRYINHGVTTLEGILEPLDNDISRITPVTSRESEVAASVITWLGTNCGWSFLQETLRTIEVERAKKKTDNNLINEKEPNGTG